MNLHTAIWLSVGITNLKPLSCGIHMTGILASNGYILN